MIARIAAIFSQAFGLTFLAILAALHFLEPEFDPSWRMISEYALGRHGWLMSLAFFCWAGSVLCLTAAVWSGLASRLPRAWLLLVVGALVGAGVFRTNPILDDTPRLGHTLHAACGALVILTFPAGATLVTRGLPDRTPLETWATRATWLGLVGFFGSIAISRALHPGAGRVGPDVLLGWPNRAMVVLYLAWILVTARRAGSGK